MTARFACLFVLFAVFAGCSTRATNPVVGPDFSYRSIRQQIATQPIPTPTITPFDANSQLRAAFLYGFNKGWSNTCAYGPGNLIVIPQEYHDSTTLAQSWQDGYRAGQKALCSRIVEMSASGSH